MTDYDKVIEIVKSTKKIVTDENLRGQIEMKGEADFVTGVDLSISNYIKEKVLEIDDQIGFMSEEETNGVLPENRWILDPIDGTTNLVFDYRLSSVSLALLKNNEIVFGVVYNPFNDDLFTAIKGKGAFLNGKPLFCVDREPKDSLIEFGAGSTRKGEAKGNFKIAESVFEDCLDIRRICSTALSISYIAAGRINGYFEKVLKPWDYAAASLILTEAGGKITDWNAEELQFDAPSGIICGTPKVYSYLLEKTHN